ncbi:MAG: long-chain fatty acid--CoA ligase [Myxococcales bacterium]
MAEPIAPWFFERLEEFRDEPAIVFGNLVATYGQLLERVAFWNEEMTRHGVGAGSVVVLEGGFSPNAVAALLVLVQRGAIAVPLTPLVSVQRPSYEEIAEAGWTFIFDPTDDWTVTRHARSVTHELTRKLLERGHPGLVIFSSGSTGKPKAILHDFSALLEKFRRPSVKKRTMGFLLFDHIGGLDTLFNTLASGGALVTVPNRDPDVVCQAIAQHQVHTLPASPTFLNLLLISDAWKRHDLSSLQLIAYGTEPMPATLLARLGQVFPQAKLLQTYGMSELGVLRTRSREPGSLWMRFSGEGFETKIVDGTLWVRTPTAMLGYLNAPHLFDAEGWLNTEDAVEVDGEFVRVLGRVSDLVNIGGQKVYPAEVENVLMTMDNVADVVVYGEPHPLTGKILAARINLRTPEPFDAFKKRLRAFCRERLPSFKIPARIEVTDAEQFGQRLKKLRQAPAAGSGSGGQT